MGFIKNGAQSRIVRVASTPDALQLSNAQMEHLHGKLAALDFINLNPDKFIYTRERAVSAYERYGLNGNADGFMDEELKMRYATFINAPRHIDHNNADPKTAIGIVLDAVYHPLTHPKGGWVETISARDKEKMAQVKLHHFYGSPTLLDAVLNGDVTDVSMGCYVENSICTVCGNNAVNMSDYCNHVLQRRGQLLKAASTSPVMADANGFVVSGELNYGVTFFELSDITSTAAMGGGGADADAKILEKIACNGWECYVIDRKPALEKKQYQRTADVCSCADSKTTHRLMEENMDRKKKRASDVAPPLAPDDSQSITDRGEPDPKDEDKGLYDQSQGTSESSPAQVVTDVDNITQDQKDKDYPLKGAAMEADPSNLLGGTPEAVEEGEEKIESIPEKGILDEDDDDKMPSLANDLGILFKQRFPRIAESEKFKSIQDDLDILERKRARIDASIRRTRSATRKKDLAKTLNNTNAEIVKYFEQFGGNPQELDNMSTSGDSESEDSALYDQSKGTSETNDETAVLDEEDIAQEPDSTDYPQDKAKGARLRIKAANAEAAVEEALNMMKQDPGLQWDQAIKRISEKYPEVDPSNMKRNAGNEDSAPETDQVDGTSDISQPVGDDVEEIEKGNLTTLVSPATEKVAPTGTELIQARLSRSRKALRNKVLGEGGNSQDADLAKGNTETLSSPETQQIADTEDLVQKKKLDFETQGVDAPAPITSELDMARRIISKFRQNDAFLRDQNERLFKRTEAYRKHIKWDSVKKIAFEMHRKGFFFHDGKRVERNRMAQKQAMLVEAKSMMRMTLEELEERKELIARAPMPGRTIKEWERKIERPRDGSVKNAVAQSRSIDPDAEAFPLFE